MECGLWTGSYFSPLTSSLVHSMYVKMCIHKYFICVALVSDCELRDEDLLENSCSIPLFLLPPRLSIVFCV